MADDSEGRISPIGGLTATRTKRPGGLGRGLSALMGDVQADTAVAVPVNGGVVLRETPLNAAGASWQTVLVSASSHHCRHETSDMVT